MPPRLTWVHTACILPVQYPQGLCHTCLYSRTLEKTWPLLCATGLWGLSESTLGPTPQVSHAVISPLLRHSEIGNHMGAYHYSEPQGKSRSPNTQIDAGIQGTLPSRLGQRQEGADPTPTIASLLFSSLIFFVSLSPRQNQSQRAEHIDSYVIGSSTFSKSVAYDRNISMPRSQTQRHKSTF